MIFNYRKSEQPTFNKFFQNWKTNIYLIVTFIGNVKENLLEQSAYECSHL